MKINLYEYNGRANVANKLITRLNTPIWNGNIVPDGKFTPLGGAFRLSTLYDCNYAKYTWNGTTYYAYIHIDTIANGLYLYHVDVDPLATAYYAGCLNSVQYYKYLSDWYSDGWLWYGGGARATHPLYNIVIDNRMTKACSKTINEYNILAWQADYIYAVGVVKTDGINPTSSVEAPNINVYMMDVSCFAEFYSFIQGKTDGGKLRAQKLYTVIPFMYRLPRAFYPYADDFTPLIDSITIKVPQNDGYESYIFEPDHGAMWTGNLRSEARTHYITYSSATPYLNVNQSNITSTQRIHIQEVGDIVFTYADVTVGNSINKLGFKINYDFSDGIVIAKLCIDDIVHEGFVVQSKIPNQIVLAYDGYITDYSGIIVNGVNAAVSVATHLAMQDYGGAIATAALDAIGIGTSIYQENRRDSLTPTTIVGNGVSSTDRPWQRGSLFIYAQNEINSQDIVILYGSICCNTLSLYDVISGATYEHVYGFQMTENCNLPSNGVPFEVIKEANALMNHGFILAPPSAAKDPYYGGIPDLPDTPAIT